MTVREFSYWWGAQNPCPIGIIIPWQNSFELGVSDETYFKEYIFSGTFYNYATAQPRHGVVSWFMNGGYDYPAGWSNHNWKVAMYIPCHPEPKPGSGHNPHFTQHMINAYVGVNNGPYGSGKSKKLVQLGYNNNMPVANEGSNCTPQNLYDTVIDIRAAIAAAKPGLTPNFNWIGPNIMLHVNHFSGADAWRNGSNYMNAFDALWEADPNFVPTIFGFSILADTVAEYQTRFNQVATYMNQWPTKNFRLSVSCNAPDSATQIAVMDKALSMMAENAKCKGVYWRYATNEFGAVNCPWPLAQSTGYPPSGHFPWPFAVTAVGAHLNNRWNALYSPIPNPLNAPANTVQPYPISNPA